MEPKMQLNIVRCADMPSPRAAAISFVIGDRAYVFGGRDNEGHYLNDMWCYDSSNNTWIDLGVSPLAKRVNAAACVQGDSVFIGLGFAQARVYEKDSYLRDWWCWKPSTNTWTSMADYPNASTIRPATYTIEDRVYVIYGTAGCFTREINYYESRSNSWHALKDNHRRALSGFGGIGVTCQQQTFYGLGYNTSNLTQWYKMDLDKDKWIKCKSILGKGRTCSTCSASEQSIYVFGGRYLGGENSGGEVFADILQYNPEEDNWILAGRMPCGEAENQVSFNINNKIYFGLGEDKNGKVLNTLYYFEE
jgi:N-acetylneuraminic acid mutarotase